MDELQCDQNEPTTNVEADPVIEDVINDDDERDHCEDNGECQIHLTAPNRPVRGESPGNRIVRDGDKGDPRHDMATDSPDRDIEKNEKY